MKNYEDGLALALTNHLYKQNEKDKFHGIHNIAEKYMKHCNCMIDTIKQVKEVFDMKDLYAVSPESMIKALMVDAMMHKQYRDPTDIANIVYEHANCLIERMVSYK